MEHLPGLLPTQPAALCCSADAYVQIVDDGDSETFLDWIFGTDCYSQVVRSLNAECRRLDQDQQARLGLNLANCFLSKSGKAAFPCSARQDTRTCTSRLDQEAFNTYQQFFLNVYRYIIRTVTM